jgi:hypothetical protein
MTTDDGARQVNRRRTHHTLTAASARAGATNTAVS